MTELLDHRPCKRCHGTVVEPIEEGLASCCYCGLLVRVPGARPAPPPGEWKLQAGRFAGMTLAEAAAQPNGRRYLEVLRDSDDKLRARIEAFLEETPATISQGSDELQEAVRQDARPAHG